METDGFCPAPEFSTIYPIIVFFQFQLNVPLRHFRVRFETVLRAAPSSSVYNTVSDLVQPTSLRSNYYLCVFDSCVHSTQYTQLHIQKPKQCWDSQQLDFAIRSLRSVQFPSINSSFVVECVARVCCCLETPHNIAINDNKEIPCAVFQMWICAYNIYGEFLFRFWFFPRRISVPSTENERKQCSVVREMDNVERFWVTSAHLQLNSIHN